MKPEERTTLGERFTAGGAMEYELTALGDQGLLIRCADEEAVFRLSAAVREASPPWIVDVVPAYLTVALFIDYQRIGLADAERETRRMIDAALRVQSFSPPPSRLHLIPCCYQRQQDFDRVARTLGLDADSVIRLHSSVEYRVYAVGFCPGFPYLGYLPKELTGMPRLAEPRVRVEPGSVGITGRQTGIYPLPTPGGWNLIGQTPLTLVDVKGGFFPIQSGDRVRFVRIDEPEFSRRKGERLGA